MARRGGRSVKPLKRKQPVPQQDVTPNIQPRNGQPLLDPPRLQPTPEQRGVALVKYHDHRSRRQIVEAICVRIINGARVHVACGAEGITWSTLWLWKAEDNELSTLYARAREASAESWEDKSTEYVENASAETVQLARLKEDNARWRAKNADRRRFGDRVDVAAVSAQVTLEELVAGSMALKPGD